LWGKKLNVNGEVKVTQERKVMIYFELLSMSVPARSEYNPELFKGIAGPQPVSELGTF
jgi:hypothetical protein